MELFVSDTTSLISYFNDVFSVPDVLSPKARRLIKAAVSTAPTSVRISIPSIALIEIYEKWLVTEECLQAFHYEVLGPLRASPNIEIRPIDKEIIDNLLSIKDNLADHEINDKIVVASAIALNCPIITNDGEIIKYSKRHQNTPLILT